MTEQAVCTWKVEIWQCSFNLTNSILLGLTRNLTIISKIGKYGTPLFDNFECFYWLLATIALCRRPLATMKMGKKLSATFSNFGILVTLQNNSQSYNWILLAHVVIKTARIKGSRASLNAIAVAVSLRDSADVPFWLPGACDCCHKFETRFFSNKVNGTFFRKHNALQCLTLNTKSVNYEPFNLSNKFYLHNYLLENYLFW